MIARTNLDTILVDEPVTSRKGGHRGNTDAVLRRCHHLDEGDELLLRQVLAHGVSTQEVAAVSGVSRRSVQRRVRELTDRLSHPCVVRVLRSGRYWSTATREVAMALWVRGHTLRRAAADLGLTLHQVRQQAQVVRELLAQAEARALQADAPPAPGVAA